MVLEYEYRYCDYDKDDIISKIVKLGGKKKDIYLFKVIVFKNPLAKEGSYIRIRDEGYKITMTIKERNNKDFLEEKEIIIDNYNTGIEIMYSLGCTKAYAYEKIREIWNIKDVEIVFDTNPGRTDIMEIEALSKKKLNNIIKQLELDELEHDNFTDGGLYLKHFGIDIKNKKTDLTFKNASLSLKSLVTKNINKFNKLIKSQLLQYNKLIKK